MQLLKIGTRKSKLAVWQAELVARKLQILGVQSELVYITSKGDAVQDRPAQELGLGVFTKALDDALLVGDIDIAVHSLKDVPTIIHDDLELKSVLERGSPWDVLVLNDENYNPETAINSIIATGSPRRKAFWLNKYSGHEIVGLRGNVDRRIELLKTNNWDGAIMALAGIDRLGIECHYQPLEWMTPQPGQGAVCVMAQNGAHWFSKHLDEINNTETELLVNIERSFLKEMGGGCSRPIAAFAELYEDKVILRVNVLSYDGKENIELKLIQDEHNAQDLGFEAARIAKEKGALALINSSND